MAIDFSLTPEQKQIQESARSLAARFAQRAPVHDQQRTTPFENYKELREAGFHGIVIPQEYGGMGRESLNWIIAAEELAQGCASTALAYNMHVVSSGIIMNDPSIASEVKRGIAARVLEEGSLICASISEPTSSAHLIASYRPTLEAQRVPGGYRLSGRKMFQSMWEASDYGLTYAHIAGDSNPDKCVCLLVPTKETGITVEDIWHTPGMRATRSQRVILSEVFVSDDLVLGHTDKFTDAFWIDAAMWVGGCYTGVYVGLGMGILNFARRFLAERVTKGFTQPMGYHPDIRRRVSEMACDMEGAKLSIWQTAWMYDTQGPSESIFLHVLKSKYLAGEAVTRTARNASIACGMHALFQDQPLERMIRDALTAPINPPNADTCLSLIGLMEMGLNPQEALPPLKGN